ncbi:MAG: CHRD domain-containing protein [bacterium]|jgi:hypothetical protein|nr:CHRD domain-containing protein [bacterium]
MKTRTMRMNPAVHMLALAAVLALGAPVIANAAVVSYTATLSGTAESPPNASMGTGFAQVDIDPVAHTMNVFITFEGLSGVTTACHIHGPTTVAGTGTAGVATTTPTFPGFPAGVAAGMYDQLFDMTLTASFNGSFVANNGGTAATAEAALFQAITDGKTYVNVHSNLFPGGEIRGFLTAAATPTDLSSWGQVKSLYR